ncbi:hypothetical protein BOTCAL_0026g00500 [Botryotinia calthae]|uniref:Uncharacterized protein n=1 Tax=Botryotinia calthae TaxID=38488 RepID=A0A4Y8DGP3_9HELO|nr:hypothetical protein BOTCAL_0026g00500 [Botryotinia calthae]
MSAEEVPTPSCQATQTFHYHCGHIITTFIEHSELCEWNQESRPTTPKPTLSRQAISSSAIAKASSKLHRSASSALKGVGNSLGNLARRLSIRSPQPAHEFSFTARVPCPGVLFQPLYESPPCPGCAKALGMGPEDLDKSFAGSEEERWQQRKETLKAKMNDWVVKMGEWERGVRVPRKE